MENEDVKAKVRTEGLNEDEKRIIAALSMPRLQVSYQLAKVMGINEKMCKAFIEAFPRAYERSRRLKKKVEAAVKKEIAREKAAGRLQEIKAQKTPGSVSHDSRFTRRRTNVNGVGKTVVVGYEL